MPARSVALVVLVTAVWGVNFVVIHVGLDHFPPLLFNALRFTCMALPAIFLVGRPRVPWRFVVGVRLPARRRQVRAAVRVPRPRHAGRALVAAAAAAGDLHDRVRRRRSCASGRAREQVAGAAIAFAGLAVIGIDRAASAPVLPFLLIARRRRGLGRDERDHARGAAARPARACSSGRAWCRRSRCSGCRCCSRARREIGDALAGVDAAAIAALLFVALAGGPVRLRGLDDAAQAPHRRGGHAVRAARAGVRDRERRAAAGRAPERARAGRRRGC